MKYDTLINNIVEEDALKGTECSLTAIIIPVGPLYQHYLSKLFCVATCSIGCYCVVNFIIRQRKN
ncbi:hypothetical protein T4C_8343 [Trichinella pseudospiralis]|uniref:Uncharacterized protein n=1 Tax=Trichinella pseudospiralis TaxID=6337 RepID=A0A0V1KGR8_TRIPS|nr:hypothetical protein T4C_8343 [Trichinella pseudospiralis]